MSLPALRFAFSFLAAGAGAPLFAAAAADASTAAKEVPPKSWIDPDTGHRVIRITDEPGSASLYFNDNSCTPDGKQMVYTAGGGISVVDLTTFKTRPLVPAPARVIVVGHKTPTVYYTKGGGAGAGSALYGTNIDTGETRKIADLPPRMSISAINADETLGAGTFNETDPSAAARPATPQAPMAVAGSRIPASRVAAYAVGRIVEVGLIALGLGFVFFSTTAGGDLAFLVGWDLLAVCYLGIGFAVVRRRRRRPDPVRPGGSLGRQLS